MTQDPESGESGADRKTVLASRQIVIVLVVLAVFAGVLVAKAVTGRTGGTAQSSSATTAVEEGSSSPAQGDAEASYEAALKTGKPIYVMFHSTTCQPCVEIDAVAKRVIPDYAEKIAFVDAVTNSDPSVQQLAAKLPAFQYIPQSFFLKSDGTTADSFTGAMSESEMRARLDALLAQQ